MTTATRTTTTTDARDVRERRGLFFRTVGGIWKGLGWCLLALFLSIIVEWIGIATWWSDQGVNHSRTMLKTELQYLNEDFKRWVVDIRPAEIARKAARFAYQWVYVKTGLKGYLEWLGPGQQVGESSESTRLKVRRVYIPVSKYVIAALTITQLFAIRLTIALLSTPAFLLLGLVGLIEGLVRRDLRRFGGGYEHALVYHAAKKWIVPFVVVAWIAYLAMPVSLHPNWVFIPAAGMFGVSIMITAATFKKHL